VERELTDAAIFTASGEVVQPSEASTRSRSWWRGAVSGQPPNSHSTAGAIPPGAERARAAASDLVNQKIYDLLTRGAAAAKANGRDIINSSDLPITKGLQERIHEFREMDEEIELKPILDYIAARRPLDLTCSVETEAQLPWIVGGLSVALARTFKITDPTLKNPPDDAVGACLPHLRLAVVGLVTRSVPSASGAAGVRVWEVTSR
jgi:Domain of unknown function (DUF1931)